MEASNSYSVTLKNNSWYVLPKAGEILPWQVIQLVLTVRSVSIIIMSDISFLSRRRRRDGFNYEVTTGLKWDGRGKNPTKCVEKT